MHASFKKIIWLVGFVSLGLLMLQTYWTMQEWKRNKEVIEREASVALIDAVNAELETRRDSLKNFLYHLLRDTNSFKFSTMYLPKYDIWSIKIQNAADASDFTNWSSKKIPVGPRLNDSLKEAIIHEMLDVNITRNVVMYYTERLGDSWRQQFDSLALDTTQLASRFQSNLLAVGIKSSFDLQFLDTAVDARIPKSSGTLAARPVSVQLHSIWDSEEKWVVLGEIKNPFGTLFKRQWISILATILLMTLTLYCMYHMYRVIQYQKKLADIKNDFIGNITHELKTPLATIAAAIDSLQHFNGWEDPHRKDRYLNSSRLEIVKLNQLIDQIMEISVYEKESLQLNKTQIEPALMIKESMNALSIQYGLEINFTLTPEANNVLIFADKTQMESAIQNILENAVKHHGEPHNLIIGCSIWRDHGTTHLKITDNGAGIHKDFQPLIFDKFYRVPTGNRHDVKGFGLGLYYVKKILVAHKGDVEVQSEPGKGTTIHLTIPNADE